MSRIQTLKAAGCRIDGLTFAPDGSAIFVTTNANGSWTDAQKQAVLVALGRAPAMLTPAQQKAAFAAVIQAWLDQTAQSFGYNNLAYAVSYATSSVDLWKRQGAAFLSWRDAVWQGAFSLLAEVQAGTAPLPASNAALIAALPQPSIPTS